MDKIPFPLFSNGFDIHAIARGKSHQAFLTILYLSRYFRNRSGASMEHMAHKSSFLGWLYHTPLLEETKHLGMLLVKKQTLLQDKI